MSFYKAAVGKPDILGSFQATVHTTSAKTKYKHLRGMASYVIDVGPSGGLGFDIPEALWRDFMYNGHQHDDVMMDHFRKLGQKYEMTWVRPLHNPHIAFVDNRPYDLHRTTVARYYVRVMAEMGYSLHIGVMK